MELWPSSSCYCWAFYRMKCNTEVMPFQVSSSLIMSFTLVYSITLRIEVKPYIRLSSSLKKVRRLAWSWKMASNTDQNCSRSRSPADSGSSFMIYRHISKFELSIRVARPSREVYIVKTLAISSFLFSENRRWLFIKPSIVSSLS
jgi:hypothetical protein